MLLLLSLLFGFTSSKTTVDMRAIALLLVFLVVFVSLFCPSIQSGSNSYQQELYQKMSTFLVEEGYQRVNGSQQQAMLTDEQRLMVKLFRYYDTASRPVYNASQPVVIHFGIALIQICDMDERNQILTTNVWLEQEWIDERLKWNISEYNNLNKLRIPCNKIWLPDIVLYNSADDYTSGYMQSRAMLKPDGTIFWPPPVKLRSSCKIDVTFFPFDDQICQIKFGSWTYSGLQVDLINNSNTSDLSNYVKSGEWELMRVTAKRNVQYYPCCPDEPYPDIVFYIYIRRRILYYLFNIIFPCVWLSILSLVGFWLPPDSGEKITLGITVLLAFSVFMLLIAENIPATSEMVPLIGIYLTTTMSLTSMSILLTVVVLQLHYSGQFAPEVPRHFYRFMTRRLAVWMCMRGTVDRYEAGRHRVTIVDDEATTSDKKSGLCYCHRLFKCNYTDAEEPSSSSSSSEELQVTTRASRPTTSYSNYENLTEFYQQQHRHHHHEIPCSKSSPIFLVTKPSKEHHQHHQHRRHHHHHHHRCKHHHRNTAAQNTVVLPPPPPPSETIWRKRRDMSSSEGGSSSLEVKAHSHSPACRHKHKYKCRQRQTPPPPQPHPPPPDYVMHTMDKFNKNVKRLMGKQETANKKENMQNEWRLIALIIDRVLFWLFTTLTVVSTVVILIVIPVMKNANLIKPYHDSFYVNEDS